jgi:hypothetical protein
MQWPCRRWPDIISAPIVRRSDRYASRKSVSAHGADDSVPAGTANTAQTCARLHAVDRPTVVIGVCEQLAACCKVVRQDGKLFRNTM